MRHAGETGRIIHYLYEPGSFVPVVQAIRLGNMSLHKQPVYSDHYRLDEDPLWATQPEPEPFSELLWYQCDHLGTPQELTNQQGEIVWRAQHKAWGETQEQRSDWAQHKGIQNPLRFQGQYHDHETGLHYNRYRYYDPLVGRFISKDPIGYAGGLNLYVYAPNPVFWIDPFGLSAVCKRCLPNCTDDTYRVRKDEVEMARELSNKINRNSVGFSTSTTQGHIDLQGASHYDKATGADIPTPHVQSRKINVGPNGQVTTSKKTEVTRAATKEDVRVARELARRKGLCK